MYDKMKKYDTKTIWRGMIFPSLLLLLQGLLATRRHSFLMTIIVGIGLFSTVVAVFRWTNLYSIKFKDKKPFDVGFDTAIDRVPCYLEGEPKLNALMISVYKWIAVVILLALILFVF